MEINTIEIICRIALVISTIILSSAIGFMFYLLLRGDRYDRFYGGW